MKDQFAQELIQTFKWETGVGVGAVFAPSMAYHGDRSLDFASLNSRFKLHLSFVGILVLLDQYVLIRALQL